jgi:hypothetical protein
MEKPQVVRCSDCGVQFNPQKEGVTGEINRKPVSYCGPCCRKDYE